MEHGNRELILKHEGDICGVHEEFVGLMRDLSTDLKWVVRIGKYFLGMVGAVALFVIIPIGIFLIQTMGSMQTELKVTTNRLSNCEILVGKNAIKNEEQEKQFQELRDLILKHTVVK